MSIAGELVVAVAGAVIGAAVGAYLAKKYASRTPKDAAADQEAIDARDPIREALLMCKAAPVQGGIPFVLSSGFRGRISEVVTVLDACSILKYKLYFVQPPNHPGEFSGDGTFRHSDIAFIGFAPSLLISVDKAEAEKKRSCHAGNQA